MDVIKYMDEMLHVWIETQERKFWEFALHLDERLVYAQQQTRGEDVNQCLIV